MKQARCRNAKFAIILLLAIFLTSTAIAETNVSILYGWNGTAFAPVNIESDGSLKTTLNLSESIGIYPKDDSLYNLGSSSLKWLTGYFSNVSATQVCIGASCRTTWPSGGGSAWDISTSNYLINNSDILDVNETKLNETIDAFDSNVSLLYGYNQSESEFRPVSITSGGALKMSVVEQSGLSGWVDDGTTVRLATLSDRVGIGTTSPTHELHVVGDANITDTVYAHNFSGNSDIVFINSTGDELVTIKDNGRVGIGTSSPGNMLHIHTTIDLGASVTDLLKLSAANTDTVTNDGLGLIFNITDSTDNRVSISKIESILPSTGVAADDERSSILKFYTTDNGTTSAQMVIDSSGNVGIGTTNLDGRLHVTVTDGSTKGLILERDEVTANLRSAQLLFRNTDGNDSKIYAGGDESLSFATPSTDPAMTIIDSGNVGIGITNPINLLHINEGNLRFESAYSANSANGIVYSYKAANTISAQILFNSTASYTANEPGEIQFWTRKTDGEGGGAVAQNMVIKSSGNVGIGTTSPGYALDVKQSVTGGVLANLNNSHATSGTWLRYEAANAGIERWQTGANTDGWNIYNENDSATRVTVDNNGNVGIGTTSPQSGLQVGNGATAGTTYIQIDGTGGTPPSADCDATAEHGRMNWDWDNNRIYICDGLEGWKYINVSS